MSILRATNHTTNQKYLLPIFFSKLEKFIYIFFIAGILDRFVMPERSMQPNDIIMIVIIIFKI